MLKFRKGTVIKTAVAVFCAGVLLGGIGTGVAIAEYTSLEYTGEHILDEEKMKTENLDVTVVPKEGKKIRIWRNYQVNRVSYGEDVPMNTIRYTITYNPEMVNFWTNYEEYEEVTEEETGTEAKEESTGEADEEPTDAGEEDPVDPEQEESQYQGGIMLEYYYTGDEFDLFMKNKDKILEELKHGQIGSYRTESIKSVEIWMNPGMKEYIELS